ncbi:unnamed protein product, partial [Prorocentrum cordatum]
APLSNPVPGMACTHAACPLFGALPASADELGRCRRCGQALPGAAAAAVEAAGPPLPPGLPAPGDGSAAAAPPPAPGPGLVDDGTGLTQAAVHLNLSDSDIDVEPGGGTGFVPPKQGSQATGLGVEQEMDTDLADDTGMTIRDTLFREWAEQEIIVHFELIQAMAISNPSVNQLPIALPKDLDALKMICRKLAYGIAADRGTLAHGLALCDLTGKAPLDEEGHASIHKIADEVRAAALACEKELSGVLAERKRSKPIKLPLWKELGAAARALLCSPIAPGCQVTLLAQWSFILPDCGDSVNFVDISRRVSELLEKGDEKAWDLTAGQHVVAWAPDDAGALARLLAAFLRRSEPARRPACLQMVVPLPPTHGMKDVVGVTDLWSHPLLGDKWAPIVRSQSFCAQPLEMILPGRNQPRHVQTGLAIFGISLDSARHVPICLDLVIPATCAELDAIILLDRLRRSMATTVHFALNTIYDNREAMILEITSPECLPRLWPLCSQMTLLSRAKALVISVAASDTWAGVMDHILNHDPEVSASRLRWRPSAHGGRPVATPSATTAALAAARRKTHSGGGLEHMADIVVRGELGTQDSKVIAMLMDHVTSQRGVALQESTEPQGLRPGEYFPLRSRDVRGPPGRVRALLRDREEVRRLHASLHGQAIRVGNEHARVEILNGSILALSRPGNGTG